MNKLILLLFAVIMSSPAYAFPVAEGAAALSAIVGVIGSIVTSVIPSVGKGKHSKALLSACIILTAVSAGSLYHIYNQADIEGENIRNVRQSRPTQEERISRTPSRYTKDEIEFIKTHKNILSPSQLRSQERDSTYELVYLDAINSEYYQPWNIKRFSLEEKENAINYAIEKNGKVVFVSTDHYELINYSYEVYKKSNHIVYGTILHEYFYSDSNDWNTEEHLFNDTSTVFDVELIDIRGRLSFLESNSLANATNIPFPDILLMRDWEILEKFSNNPIFIDYKDDKYHMVYQRLKDAGVESMRFYDGGLNRHYEESKLHLTKDYINQGRVLSPDVILEIASQDKLKFICTSSRNCLDNIPKDMLINLPMDTLGRESFKDKVLSLPKDSIYVALSHNQETTGNAFLLGYWLTESNHRYAGEFPLYERFTEESLEDYLEQNEHESVEQSREHYYLNSDVGKEVKSKLETLSDSAVVLVLLMSGYLFRLALMPLQLPIIRSYYAYNFNHKALLLSALLLPAAMITAYYELYHLISVHGLFSTSQINALVQDDSFFIDNLSLLFTLLVVIQARMSFPTKNKSFILVAGVIVSLYLFGYLSSIPHYMMLFLLGSEILSIYAQSPYYITNLTLRLKEKKGFTTTAIQNGCLDYPDKWLTVHIECGFNGILTRTKPKEMEHLTREVNRLFLSKKVIVRSCSSLTVENSLGGYFESYICSSDDFIDYLTKLHKAGCDHAIIQEYYDAEVYGVASSMASNGKGFSFITGSKEDATEGTRNAVERTINRNDLHAMTPSERTVFKALLSLEKKYGSVDIEFCIRKDKLHLLQVRKNNRFNQKPTDKLLPHGLESFVIAEDYLAQCSPITGEIIEKATSKNFIFIDGFLYRSKSASYKKLLLRKKEVQSLMSSVDEALSIELSNMSHQKLLSQLDDAVLLYSNTYKATQSYISPKTVRIYSRYNVGAIRGSELEVESSFSINKDCRDYESPTRDALHDVIVKITALISRIVERLNKNDIIKGEVKLSDFLDGLPIYLYQKSDKPLSKTCSQVIVPGEIKGHYWNASNNSEDDMNTVLELGNVVLYGEEIPSNWVKVFSAVSGLLSIYGHESSHVGISARHLNIPYRKITNEELNRIRNL